MLHVIMLRKAIYTKCFLHCGQRHFNFQAAQSMFINVKLQIRGRLSKSGLMNPGMKFNLLSYFVYFFVTVSIINSQKEILLVKVRYLARF